MLEPSGRSVTPLMTGVESGVARLEVNASAGGTVSTSSTCTTLVERPKASVPEASTPTSPDRPPAGRLPPTGSAVLVSTDQVPPAPTAARYTTSLAVRGSLSGSTVTVSIVPAGKSVV